MQNDHSFTPPAKNEKKRNVKKYLIWAAVLIGVHIAFSLIYAFTLNTQVEQRWLYEDFAKAKTTVFIYGLIAQIVFSIVYTVSLMRDADQHKAITDSVKEQQKVLPFFKENYLKEILAGIAIYAALNIPYAIYFAVSTVDLANTHSFQKFYIAEMGMYLMTNNAIAGYLLSIVYFAVIFTLIRAAGVAITRKNIIKNSVTL